MSLVLAALVALGPNCAAQTVPDIRSVEPDLTVPKVTLGPPAPGRRVRSVLTGWEKTRVYHTLYLPTDYVQGKTYPVIVELAGNGGFTSRFGDVSNGLPDGSKLGYGITNGEGWIWVCAPFVSGDGQQIATRWWGTRPTFDPGPTVDYLKQLVAHVCGELGGDANRVVLAGFSRGAIACNYIGLHDDEIARLWCGFIAYSHYDGVRRWEYPGSDRDAALRRLRRLGDRPQFICHEGNSGGGLAATREWLQATGIRGRLTFAPTGFRNHADAWVLRPSKCREELRRWLSEVTAGQGN